MVATIRWAVLIVLVGASFVCRAADSQEFVLLPLYFEGTVSGANGSRWATDLVMHNGNAADVFFGPCNVPSETPCPPLVFTMMPGETLRNPTVGFTNAGRHGRHLYIPHALAPKVAFNLRVYDAASSLDSGTEIPVPRSSDFVTSAIQLLNVPTTPDDRLTLRIFDPDDRGATGRVDVRVFSLDGALLHDEEVAFSPSGYGANEGLHFAPGFVEKPLLITNASGNPSVRIEIQPVSAGLRIWGFVSVTNNVTQHVTIVSPM